MKTPPILSLSLFCFIAVVCLVDFLGIPLGVLQAAALKPAAVIGGVSLFLESVGIPFGIPEIGAGTVGILYGMQVFISIIMLCLFYAMVLASSEGEYPLSTCSIAVFVFIIESMPFLCALPVWECSPLSSVGGRYTHPATGMKCRDVPYTVYMSITGAVKIFLCTLSAFLVIAAGTPYTAAQGAVYNAYSLSFSTESPSPGETVEVTIRTDGASTGNIRSVRWYSDGEERPAFNDKLVMREIVGNTPKQIDATVVYFDHSKRRMNTRVTRWIRPVIFDLLWEGDSVTIPDYRGHHLAGPRTPITVSANIQYIDTFGIVYSENDFSFLWEVESEYHADRGPGVSRIVIEEGGTYLNNSIFIRAQATLINDSGTSFERIISVPITEPRLLIYSHTLLYGLFRYATVPKEAVLEKTPVTLSLYPLFFSAADFEKDAIQYRWFVNNNPNHAREGRRIDISLGGQSIPVPIRISAHNENKNLQKAEHTITVTH